MDKERVTLYEIGDNIRQCIYMFDDEECDEKEVNSELDKLNLSFDQKVGSCAAIIKEKKASLVGATARRKQLQSDEKRLEREIDGLSQYVKREMEGIGKRTVSHGAHRATIAKCPMSVVITDEERVPDKWVKPEWKIKKAELRQHILDTGELPTGVDIVENKTTIKIS